MSPVRGLAGWVLLGTLAALAAACAPAVEIDRGDDRLYYDRPDLREVPELAGTAADEAAALLAAYELEARIEEIDESELERRFGPRASTWPAPGTVIGQAPAAGDLAEAGSPVRLEVAARRGLAAAPDGPDVPDVRGWSLDEALAALEGLGLRVVYEPVESDRPGGTVVQQVPPAGEGTLPRDTVLLRVSAGPPMGADPGGNGDEPEGGSAGPDDGVPPPGDPGTPAGANGDDGDGDADGDGVADGEDRCAGTLVAAAVDARGCSDAQIIDLLPEGTYAFNTPEEMVVGREPSYEIVLLLEPKTPLEGAEAAEVAVTAALFERLEPRQRADPVEVLRRPFSERMSAELQGPPGWTIAPRAGSAGVRLVSATEPTAWEWDVYPACPEPTLALDCGEAELRLAVFAHFGDARRPWPLFEEKIAVRITARRLVAGFLRGNWQWLLSALVLPLLAWLWKRRRARRVGPAVAAAAAGPPVKVLFLAANPADLDTLRLDEEARAIDDAVRRAEYRDRFRLEQHWAVRGDELDDFLLRHRPAVVHFSGHGSGAGELLFAAPGSAASRPVAPATLSGIFAALAGEVRLVVLNACYSEAQAAAIAPHVDCVVGMSSGVADAAAVAFAASLYQALAYGRDVATAFELARTEAGLADLGADLAPVLRAGKAAAADVRLVEPAAA